MDKFTYGEGWGQGENRKGKSDSEFCKVLSENSIGWFDIESEMLFVLAHKFQV